MRRSVCYRVANCVMSSRKGRWMKQLTNGAQAAKIGWVCSGDCRRPKRVQRRREVAHRWRCWRIEQGSGKWTIEESQGEARRGLGSSHCVRGAGRWQEHARDRRGPLQRRKNGSGLGLRQPIAHADAVVGSQGVRRCGAGPIRRGRKPAVDDRPTSGLSIPPPWEGQGRRWFWRRYPRRTTSRYGYTGIHRPATQVCCDSVRTVLLEARRKPVSAPRSDVVTSPK